MDILLPKKKMYQQGVYLTKQVGNNAFSYNERITLGSKGKLYIPSLIQGTVADLQQGSEICFEESFDGKLISCTGLKHFLQTTFHGIHVYIVDNHNHALSFRYEHKTFLHSSFPPFLLIHIDQHSDIKPNENTFSNDDIETFVNEKTNVGNFITTAVKSGIVNEVIQVRTDYALNELVNLPTGQAGPLTRKPENYILDIDIDFRADKEITENDIQIVRNLMKQAQLVTIATSPYFIDQARAIAIIQKFLSD